MPTQRWIVEDLKHGEWEPAGWLDAPNPAQAVAIAAVQWRDVVGLQLRAILWSQATAEQQEAAEYERNLRIHLHETSGAPGTFADQWARGELRLDVNSPAKAIAYRQAVIARRGIALGVATIVVVALVIVFARPPSEVLLLASAVGLVGAALSYGRARRGLLEPGNEQAGSKAPFGVAAFILPASLVVAVIQGSWLAAILYLAAFFFGALIGIVVSEIVASRSD